MTGEVVKYKNELNNISFGTLTEQEANLAFSIFQKFKEKSQYEIKFKIEEIEPLVNYRHKGVKFSSFAFEACTKLQKLEFQGRDPLNNNEEISIVAFPSMRFNRVTKEITIRISNEIYDYLNAITDNFTRFELAEFVNIRGTYAKTLYRLLKQYRTTGWAQFDWEEFKRILGIPTNYRITNIEQRILKPSVKELTKPQDLFDTVRKPFENLKYEKLKGQGRGRGGKVIGIKFSFKKWDEQLTAQMEPTAQTGNFVPLNPNIVNKKPSIKAQGSK